MAVTKYITQKRLKELLHYSLITGLFTWRGPKGRAQKGDVAGSLEKNGYIRIKLDGIRDTAHRLAFLYIDGSFPKEVDHGNRIRNDNRWLNLTATDHIGNSRNMPLNWANTSGFCGISFDKERCKWIAAIYVNKKRVFLGRFSSISEAILVRRNADIKYGFHKNHGKLL